MMSGDVVGHPAARPPAALEAVGEWHELHPYVGERAGPSAGARALAVVRRNVLIILACIAAAVASTLYVTRRLDRIYEASASIRIEPQKASLPSLEPLLSSTSDISTEMEVLHSQSLAESIVDSLRMMLVLDAPARVHRDELFDSVHIARTATGAIYRLLRERDGAFRIVDRSRDAPIGVVPPDGRVELPGVSLGLTPRARALPSIDFRVLAHDDATDLLRANVTIERPVREANIVSIRYRSPDAQLARDVPNALAGRLIAQRQTVRQSESRSTQTFLREQIDRLSGQLLNSEDDLRNFRERERVVDLPEEGRNEVARVAQIQAHRSEIETERTSLAKLLDEVTLAAKHQRAGEPSPYRNLVAFPSLLRNQAASQLLGSLAVVEDRRAELLTRRSEQDPDVQLLSGRIREIEEQLRSLTTTYLQALTDQSATLESTIARSATTLRRFPARELELARLQRQTKLLEDLYTLLQTRLKEAEIGSSAGDATVRLVDVARLPRSPISPKPMVSAALAAIAGLLLGLAVAFARAYSDRAVHSRREVRAATGMPVLGIIPRVRSHRRWPAAIRMMLRHSPLAIDDGASRLLAARHSSHGTRRDGIREPALSPSGMQALEAFNRLDANMLFARANQASATIVLTSPLPAEGKTTVATNLALVAAQQGRRVLLLDADLRRGVLNSVFQRPRAPGLSEVLEGSLPFGHVVQSVAVGDDGVLHYLTTGSLPSNPSQLLGSSRMRGLLQLIRSEYDVVIFDTPPLNAVADAATLGTLSDGVLLVARAGVTTVDALSVAMEHLLQAGAPIIGVVLNDIDFQRDASYDSEYRQFGRYAAYHGDVASGSKA